MIFTGKPTVVGHRGLGKGVVDGHRENTVDSFLAAVTAGATWVELDVRRSADDQLVLYHDPALPDGRFVIDHPAAETGLTLLSEVLHALPGQIGVNADVKTDYEDAVDPVDRRTGALLVHALDGQTRPLLVSSFDPGLLNWFKGARPGVPLGYIGWNHFPLRMAISAAAQMGLQVVCVHTGSIGLNVVENRPIHRPLEYAVDVARRAGLELLAWCPSSGDAVRLARAGVDAVCVNDVPGTVRALTLP